jgi:hypothetical protein
LIFVIWPPSSQTAAISLYRFSQDLTYFINYDIEKVGVTIGIFVMCKIFWAFSALLVFGTGAVSAQTLDRFFFATVEYHPDIPLTEVAVSLSATTSSLSSGTSRALTRVTTLSEHSASDSGSHITPSISVPSAQILSQRDPRWRTEHIGRKTIGKRGCLVMDVAQVALENGFGSDPEEVIELITGNLVKRNGDLKTSLLDTIFPGLRVLARLSVTERDEVAEMVGENLRYGHSVLLRISHGRGSHWIRAIAAENGDVKITDPAGGHTGTLAELYGTNLVREIVVLGKS